MKRIMFIGACDKSDLLLYVSKLLTQAEQKVLLVDATREQYYSYAVPKIDAEYKITEFEGFDVAHGLFNYDLLEDYFHTNQEKLHSYDAVIIDTDRAEDIGHWSEIEHHLLVSTYDKPTIEKNVHLVRSLFATRDSSELRMLKVIVQEVACAITEEYIESTLTEFPIQWTEPSYPVYFDETDYAVKIDNQFNYRLNIKPLSKDYKVTIMELAQLISGLPDGVVKKALKLAEKRK